MAQMAATSGREGVRSAGRASKSTIRVKEMTHQELEPMKALSMRQPWAELILRRRKVFEIRTWHIFHPGLLLIHASKTFVSGPASDLGIDKDEVTQGAFVGVAKVADIRPFTKADAKLLKEKKGGDGWWGPDQYAWVLKSVQRITPIPFKGQLNLFTPPMRILRKVAAELDEMKKSRGSATKSRKKAARGTAR